MSAAQSPAARRATSPTTGVPAGVATHPYNIPLFKDGFAFSQPSNQWSYFFELRPNVSLLGSQYVQLNFIGSPVLKLATGSLSVYLNDVPINSRLLGSSAANVNIQWKVDLPLRFFKLGEFNELKIISRQQTAQGPCTDVDNFANWIRFGPGCVLHLTRKDPMRFPINSYPFPYVDDLAISASNIVTAHWEVSGASKDAIAEALGAASDVGSTPKFLNKGLKPTLTMGGGKGGNTILFQGGAGGTLNVTAGSRPGNATLTVGGTMARKGLADPTGVGLLSSYSAQIDHLPEPLPKIPTTKLGIFTFSELGIPYVHLAGAFHQHQTLLIQRPLRTDLGRESTLTIRFRHSATLNPLRSILSVYVNGIPVGSARLTADNANDGAFQARIPINELAKSLWVIDLEAYHDLAGVDCSRTYDKVAWTVVEGTSDFDLHSGTLAGMPYLEAFPYLVGSDGFAPARVPISLSASPSEAELTAASVIAARAGQVNRQSFDWDVSLGSVVGSKTSQIIVGTYSDAPSRLGSLSKDLLVYPSGSTFTIDKRLDVQASELANGAFLQAIPTPGGTGVTYVLLGANDLAIQKMANMLADPTKSLKLSGQFTALQGNGTMQAYSIETQTSVNESAAVESNNYTTAMKIVLGIIVVIIVIALVVSVLQFRRRPTRR